MSVRFRVRGKLDSAGGDKEGTVTIDRKTGIFQVRPLHSRRVYEYILGDVATMIVQRCLAEEARRKR